MKLILWIQVEIVYNESIPTVLIEGLERYAQEQKANDKLPTSSSTT